MPESPRRLLVLDQACIEWLKKQENASLAVRKLIHSQLCELPAGRPSKEKPYIMQGVEENA